MEVRLNADLEKQLGDVASSLGWDAGELAESVIAGYLAELSEVRGMVDRRYDDLKSGRVQPVDGEAFFESLRQRELELLKRHPQ